MPESGCARIGTEALFHAHWMLSGKDGSEKLGKACSAGEIEGTNVVLGLVLEVTIVTCGNSNSCSDASKGAAVIVEPDDCSSCNVASTVGDVSKEEREVQFFVIHGKGSMVVRCTIDLMVSQCLNWEVKIMRCVVLGLSNRTAHCWQAVWRTG